MGSRIQGDYCAYKREPQELVDLIVDRTLKPLAEERLKAFEDKSEDLRRLANKHPFSGHIRPMGA